MNVNWVGPAIMIAGTQEQKDYHLKRIAAGNVLWCQGFSELGAGTDLAAMTTSAVRDGDEYVINGEKVWTSYARGAEFCFLLARTDPRASRDRGVSIFLVPTDTPGLTIERYRSDLDIHEFNRMTFENVRVPASALLGEENQGWQVIKRALAHERIGGPRYQRALVVARRLERIARERGWWERDGVRTRYVAAEAACQAARLLVYQAIDAREKGLPDDLVVSLARVAIVRSERLVADLAMELLGEESLARDSIGNAQFKTSMIAGLGGGSVEVQLNTVARALLLVLNEDQASLVELAPGQVEAVPSGAGFPMGRVLAELLESGRPVEALGLRARWALAMAAELGGAAHAVVELTSAHLRERVQFGRPLAHFQALRHRVANLAVDAEATRWMVREAAYLGQERPMWLAASYAAAVGAALSPDAVQLWGARGFVYEFGVSNLIMRLQGLRLELGPSDRLAETMLAAPAP